MPSEIGTPMTRASSAETAVPSIIYGMWGLFIFAPLFARFVQIPVSNVVEGAAGPAGAELGQVDRDAERDRHADDEGEQRRDQGMTIELLAAVPSIIYGMWGLFIFAPLFARFVQIPVSKSRVIEATKGTIMIARMMPAVSTPTPDGTWA
jgi:ABC-type phosphate transport system permease subunit